ncbi:PREDICTED: DNA polymerase theta [Nicrophorus vespilloides]|uniref:DNA polymerase theta n=1 Tax=Nicrophorus vespilloides TaxID=110193 RepID=A0ABM1M8F0_NICVS|nr:PREDICTED: DNA polymerase theta [Nicrophorus vespilloides]
MSNGFFNETFDFTITSSGQVVQNINQAETSSSEDFNITIDDSKFLSESFSFTTTNESVNKPDKTVSNQAQNQFVTPVNNKENHKPFVQLNVTVNKSHSKAKADDSPKVSIKQDISLDSSYENTPKKPSNFMKRKSLRENKLADKSLNRSVLVKAAQSNGLLADSSKLSSWGLPEVILQKYESRNVKNMFPWQVECLSLPDVLDKHKNLVYSAPTSAGKTLVAEILAIKTVLERNKKVLFILPFVSVVREKMFYFQDILGPSGIRVEGFMGSYNPPGGFKPVQLAICTMEKANSLINRFLEEGSLEAIGAVVVDEMHLLGDPNRGYLLELLLTKLRYMSLRDENVNIQIIGMSATLPNLSLLASWLDAELYTTQFRPIPLVEQCHVNGEIYGNDLKLIRKLEKIPELTTDTDNILQLCLETILTSCSVLIFCPSKSWCESLSQQIAMAFWKLGCSKSELGNKLREQLNADLIIECLEQLKRCPVGLDELLGKAVSFGVAFHHAGLTMDERDIVEGAFRIGCVRVLIATSTLSAGVNLPARRVIVRSPMFFGKPIDTLVYRQMIGRAGRMGKDVAGESILICQNNDQKVAKELMSSNLQPIESCLEGAGKLKRAILEVIASDVASSPSDITLFTKCTLLASDHNNKVEINNPIDDSVDFLIDNQFIKLQNLEDGTSKYVATPLAKACLSSSMPPEEGLALFTELEKARQCFVLETELHLIYLVTPYSACNQIGNLDWMAYLDLWEKLPASMKRVGELVGVRVSYLINGTRGKIQTNTSKLYEKLLVHKRFYTALILQDLVNEVPLNNVAATYNCNRGMLQSLQQSAASFAGMVTSFSKQLGWSSVEILIEQFQDRLQFGISRDLLDLMKLPVLNGQRARTLYNAGVETLVDLASCEIDKLESILYKSAPFESEKERDGESELDAKKRNKVRAIWVTGKQGLTEREAALMLINDARTYLQLELGLKEAKWTQTQEEAPVRKSQSPKEVSVLLDISQQSLELSLAKSNVKNNICLESITNTEASVSMLEDKILENLEEKCKDIEASMLEENFSPNEDTRLDENISSSMESINVSISLTPSANRTNLRQSTKSNDSLFGDSFSVDSKVFDDLETPIQNIAKEDSLKKLNIPVNPRKRERVSTHSMNSEEEIFYSEATPIKKSKYLQMKDNECVDASYVISEEKSEISIRDDEESQIDLTKLEIINVSDHSQLLETFKNEITGKSEISIAIACEKITEVKPVIGPKIIPNDLQIEEKTTCVYKGRQVVGFSVCWGENIAFYLQVTEKNCEALEILKAVLANKDLTVKVYDCKEHIKVLKRCCGVDFETRCLDPKVADWLLEPEEKEKNLQALVLNYSPEAVKLCQMAGNSKGSGSVSLDLQNGIKPKVRCCIEAVVCFHLVDAMKSVLAQNNSNLLHTFGIEMDCMVILARMELSGFGVDLSKMQILSEKLKEYCTALETKAHQLAGKRFSLTSSTEVAKVIGLYKGKRVRTNKQVLEQNNHPISNLIIQWRKLNSTLTKMIYPLLRMVENNRVYGCCITRNATGRVSMHEPNLQNMPRNFEYTNPLNNEIVNVSCRGVFVAQEKNILLAADYCQLELRLLAHFSQDKLLVTSMKKSDDVFKSIAAQWNNMLESEVTDSIRQQTKQICYGVIYGMGTKTLADQMCVTEDDAVAFIATFHKTYPGIKKYVEQIVDNCRNNGYVQSIGGRKRFLPNIKHQNASTKSQAERQAFNTTIQATAADIVKNAMVLVENQIHVKFKSSRNKPKLILQIHDEILYEVPKKYLICLGRIVQKCMEDSVKLSVPFPIKLKSGKSWGEMKDLVV